MSYLSSALLGSFRHQLWLEHIEVVEEFQNDTHYIFAINSCSISYWSMDNLRRIAPFGVVLLYVDGNKSICLSIAKDS